MKITRCCILMVAALIFFTSGRPANNYILSKGYVVTINGTSNLHDWKESVGTVTGNGIISWNSNGTFDMTTMSLKMSVRSIKSTEGSAMDKNTYKALKASSYPDIAFILAAPVKAIAANGGNITAKVNLSIAGVTKAIDINIRVVTNGHGNISFEGQKTIAMTDYGVKPPVALLGTLKTGNNITINFKTAFAATN